MGHSMKMRLATWIGVTTALVLVLVAGFATGAGAKALAPLPSDDVPGKQFQAADPLPVTHTATLDSPDASLTIPALTDTEIVQGYPNANCGDASVMYVGYDDTMEPDGKILRGMVRFDLSAIPPGASITSAQLQVYHVASWDYDGFRRSIDTYRITSPWAEDLVTWNLAPTISEKYGSANVLAGDWNWYSMDVTGLVRGWQNGTYPNYGIEIRGPEHSGSDSSWRGFATTKTTLPARLVVGLGSSATVGEHGLANARAATSAPGNLARSTYLPMLMNRGDAKGGMVILLIGISDYLKMAPHPAPAERAGAPGYDLMYAAADSMKLADEFSMIGGDGTAAGASGLQGLAAVAAAGNMRLLTNSQATKAAIQDAIVNWVDQRETSQTTVVIFFSGHGTRGKDVAPLDEADGLDEYIVPYDVNCNPCGSTPSSTTWDLSTAIRDDELSAWLSELESQHIVVIADSCNSGGIANAPADSGRGLWNAAEPATPDGADGLLADVAGPGRLILTASAANETSREYSALGDGVFTYFLLKALGSKIADANRNGSVSGEEAFAYLAGRVSQYTGGQQNPQIYDGIGGEVGLTSPGNPPSACPAPPTPAASPAR